MTAGDRESAGKVAAMSPQMYACQGGRRGRWPAARSKIQAERDEQAGQEKGKLRQGLARLLKASLRFLRLRVGSLSTSLQDAWPSEDVGSPGWSQLASPDISINPEASPGSLKDSGITAALGPCKCEWTVRSITSEASAPSQLLSTQKDLGEFSVPGSKPPSHG